MFMKMPSFAKWIASKDGLEYCIYHMPGEKYSIEVKEGRYIYGVFGESHEDAAEEFVDWFTRGKGKSEKVERYEGESN